MRISDWSSDVCSSDLTLSGRPEGMDKAAWRRQRELLAISRLQANVKAEIPVSNRIVPIRFRWGDPAVAATIANASADAFVREEDRKSVVCGTRVSERVDLGGRRIIHTKRTDNK